jgi:hypothetical protein
MKKVIFAMLVAAVTAAIAVPLAVAGGGNSDAANACKQGGWQNLVRQDGTGFNNQGDCVSYAAKGGVPTARSISGATGDVTWDYKGLVTGTVSFDANQKTGGSLDYQNSNGMWLHAVVTSYRQIDDHTAVFAGTITGTGSFIVNGSGGTVINSQCVGAVCAVPAPIVGAGLPGLLRRPLRPARGRPHVSSVGGIRLPTSWKWLSVRAAPIHW